MCAAATKRGRRERWSRAPGSRLGLGDVQRRVSDHCWDGAHAGVHRGGPPGLGARRRCRIRGAASGMGVGLSQEVSAAPEGVGIQKAAQGSQQQEKNRDALRFGRPLCPRGGGAQAGSCSRKFAAGRLRGPASRGCRGTHTGDIATRVTHRGGIATPVG
ncbi:MAG: hypothetical protein J3K34DRAFT_189504 [Monoraphidium minutum]|nr:MAG: hypothetical protein J3K34DRAFT_189504 [Monoraphidium minutum]